MTESPLLGHHRRRGPHNSISILDPRNPLQSRFRASETLLEILRRANSSHLLRSKTRWLDASLDGARYDRWRHHWNGILGQGKDTKE